MNLVRDFIRPGLNVGVFKRGSRWGIWTPTGNSYYNIDKVYFRVTVAPSAWRSTSMSVSLTELEPVASPVRAVLTVS